MADNSYQEFQNFQTAFYTDINKFQSFTNFEFKRNGYLLFNSLAKGFPALVDLIGNTQGVNWRAIESPAIMKALQRKFVNNFNSSGIPKFIYFKNLKEEKKKEPRVKETKLGLIFNDELKTEICSILKIDSKTYEYLKFSKSIQYLGKQLNGEFIQQEKHKKPKKKK